MNASNLTVNFAIRSRNSSKPKLIEGSESAIEGASVDDSGGRIALMGSGGSKASDIMAICMAVFYVRANELRDRK